MCQGKTACVPCQQASEQVRRGRPEAGSMEVQMPRTRRTIQGLSSEWRVRGDLDMRHLDRVS